MTGTHPELGAELRALAASILDKLDPALRAAATAAAGASAPGQCTQVFCPLCALVALIEGEQHPLLTVIAEHSLALVMMIRAIVDPGPAGEGAERRGTGSGYQSPFPASPPSSQSPGYQHIPVDIDD